MAPEQVRRDVADHRADIFAFGAVLYETLAGGRAFERPTGAETMTAILREETPSEPFDLDDDDEAPAPVPSWLGALGQMAAALLAVVALVALFIGAAAVLRRLLP